MRGAWRAEPVSVVEHNCELLSAYLRGLSGYFTARLVTWLRSKTVTTLIEILSYLPFCVSFEVGGFEHIASLVFLASFSLAIR